MAEKSHKRFFFVGKKVRVKNDFFVVVYNVKKWEAKKKNRSVEEPKKKCSRTFWLMLMSRSS